MEYQSYFGGIVYRSPKSTSLLTYRTPYELAILKSLDDNPEVVDYFKPGIAIAVTHADGRQEEVKIDFWIVFKGNLNVWLHIAEPGCTAEDEIFVLARAGCPGKCIFSVVWPPGIRMQEIRNA